MELTQVLIGIQARSTSTRLPGKCFEPLGRKRVLDHVVESCTRAAAYLNKFAEKNKMITRVVLLIPKGDPIKDKFDRKVEIVEGDEQDVLGRYKKAADLFKSDYITRITGDCPLIPPFVISKHITLALMNQYDYISNCYESRLSLDGTDCEVMSKKMLDFLHENATKPEEREHVTIYAKNHLPKWAKLGISLGYFDSSSIKLSVDTDEDLKRVQNEYEKVSAIVNDYEGRFGRQHVHRF